MVERKADSPTNLAQANAPEGNAIATGLDRDPVSDFLDALAERGVTQGGLERIGVSQLWVEAARWQVLPPAEVMRRSD